MLSADAGSKVVAVRLLLRGDLFQHGPSRQRVCVPDSLTKVIVGDVLGALLLKDAFVSESVYLMFCNVTVYTPGKMVCLLQQLMVSFGNLEH